MDKWQGRLIVRDITLRNFRQFEDLSVQFDPKLTVFIGVNGSGKTTVLEALAKVLRIFPERIQRPDSSVVDIIRKSFRSSDIKYGKNLSGIVFQGFFYQAGERKYKIFQKDKEKPETVQEESIENANINIDRRGGSHVPNEDSDQWRILDDQLKNDIESARATLGEGTFEFKEKEQELLNIFNQKVEKLSVSEILTDDNIVKTDLYWELTLNLDLATMPGNSDLSILDRLGRTMDIVRSISQTTVNLPVLVFYPCALLHENGTKSNPGNYRDPFTAYRDAFDGAPVSLQGFTHWFRAEKGRSEETKDSSLLDAVKAAIYGLLEDNYSRFHSLDISYLDSDEGELKVYKNDTPLSIAQLSSGEKMLFLIVADLARRLAIATPGSSNPCSEGSGVVLIDEIDLHLHPRWQRRVIPKLQEIFPNVQFVVTTHSPGVLQNVPKESIRVLSDGQLLNQLLYTEGRDIESVYFDAFGQTEYPPQQKEMIEKMRKVYDLIDEGDGVADLVMAERLINELAEKWGPHDKKITELRTLLSLALHDVH